MLSYISNLYDILFIEAVYIVKY